MDDPLAVLPHDRILRLAARYAQPRRWYHTWDHARAVAHHAASLGGDRPTLLAAWFHDAVYDGRPGADEAASAALLAAWLPDDPDAVEAARLVRVTAGHDPDPDDEAGAILCDADLAVLGAPPEGYQAYRRAVRREYRHLDDAAWRAGRAAVLRSLLDRPAVFRTAEGAVRWEAAARRNMGEELRALAELTVG